MADYDGPGGLDDLFSLKFKRIAGVAPVDELFSPIAYYLNTFKQ